MNQLITNINKPIDNNTVIVGDFNISYKAMERSSKQKIKKETALNDILDQMDLTDIFRIFHPRAAEYTFYSSAHGRFSKIDHILGHNTASINTKTLRPYHEYFQIITL